MTHNFKLSLVKGDAGETAILKLLGGLKKLDGRHGDLLASNGQKLELKTDYYDMQKSTNFFMERWSDVERQKPGGPWQAEGHECSLFAYYFVKNGTLFVWRLPELLKQLNSVLREKCLDKVEVPNKSWTTVGYKVPRAFLVPDLVLVHGPDLVLQSTVCTGVHGAELLAVLE